MNKHLVIIGGSAAGMKTAAKVRRECPDMKISVFTDEEYISYAGCGLPYYISGDVASKEALIHRTPEAVKTKENINVYSLHRALEISPENKTITVLNLVNNTTEIVSYDKLVIGTGARPIVPEIEGIDAKNIFCLKTIPDAENIRQAALRAKNAVVLGGGLLGVEIAEALKKLNINVTIVVSSEYVLGKLDYEVAINVQNHIESNDVKILTSRSVKKLIATTNGTIEKVVTDQEEIPADLVIIAKGIVPNVEFAVKSGIEIGKTGGIKVDKFMQTNIPDIYAGGDCVENINFIDQASLTYSSGSVANKHGKVIAENIAGKSTTFEGTLGTFVQKVFDFTIAKTGYTEKDLIKKEIDYEKVIVPGFDIAHYYPGADRVIIKMLVDKSSLEILGLQIYGSGVVDKRIDVAVMAITCGMKITDLAQADLTYAPPYSSAMDVIINAANVLLNKINGKIETISVVELMNKLKKTSDIQLLDLRSSDDYDEGHIDGFENLPYEQLNRKHKKLDPSKETIVQCTIGKTSYLAYRKLKSLGFKSVKSLEGGVTAWPHTLVAKN